MEKQTTSTGYMKKVIPQKAGVESPSKEKWYPSIHLSSKELPELKKWEVGKTYTLILEVKQKSKTENMPDEISASFDIVKIGIK